MEGELAAWCGRISAAMATMGDVALCSGRWLVAKEGCGEGTYDI